MNKCAACQTDDHTDCSNRHPVPAEAAGRPILETIYGKSISACCCIPRLDDEPPDNAMTVAEYRRRR